jgi:FlaA1/EpsC-like NDP-sugar epimerase
MNTIKSILVTGGTGSFGQAFVPFLLSKPEIERIVVYSRGEHAQANLRIALAATETGRHALERIRWMVGDVRDLARLERALTGCDAVVHAAALKRIEVGYYNPDEMVKTNIIGTMNVIEAATRTKCGLVVGLSSDKAFQPVSPYGVSKAMAESLLLAANNMHGRRGPRFAVTRYGNIWNAQGSVVPIWRSIMEGNPIIPVQLPVTDFDCTRYFMTLDEAVDLVWKLLLNMHGGEVAIPDWLPAYRLGDLMLAFKLRYGVKVEAVEKGLPSWEKLHESMDLTHCSKNARRMVLSELVELLK